MIGMVVAGFSSGIVVEAIGSDLSVVTDEVDESGAGIVEAISALVVVCSIVELVEAVVSGSGATADGSAIVVELVEDVEVAGRVVVVG